MNASWHKKRCILHVRNVSKAPICLHVTVSRKLARKTKPVGKYTCSMIKIIITIFIFYSKFFDPSISYESFNWFLQNIEYHVSIRNIDNALNIFLSTFFSNTNINIYKNFTDDFVEIIKEI